MSEVADRYRRVAAGFTRVVDAVPADAWGRPAPCEGWTARDVVDHLLGVSKMFGAGDVEAPAVDADPAAAWAAVRDTVQAKLDDPAVATAEMETPMGTSTLETLMGRFGIADVLIHTWDLARATGLDETLDPDEVTRVYEAMLPMDEHLRGGTAFGPRVEVPDDADVQTKLLAFTGRTP